MSFTQTTYYNLDKPAFGTLGADWWTPINDNFDKIDGAIKAALDSADSLFTDVTTYIEPTTASGELQLGYSGQLTEPVILVKKSIATTIAIPDPTGVTGDFIPSGNVGGHVGIFGTIVRTADSSGYNVCPYFFAFKDKAMQNGQNVNVASWFDWAGGAGGIAATAFAGWDICLGHTTGVGRLIGREINVQEARSDQGFYYSNTSGNNWSTSLALVTEHNFASKTGYNDTWALYIAESVQPGATAKWNCGIRINPEGLVRGLTYTSYFTGSYPLAIAIQLEKRQAIRWCRGSGPTIGFSHAYYYPLITGDDWGQLVIMANATYWYRFTNTGKIQRSLNGGSTWLDLF